MKRRGDAGAPNGSRAGASGGDSVTARGAAAGAAGVAAEAFSVTASCDASTQAIAPLDGVAPTPTPGVLGPAAGGGTAGAV